MVWVKLGEELPPDTEADYLARRANRMRIHNGKIRPDGVDFWDTIIEGAAFMEGTETQQTLDNLEKLD